MIKPAILLTSLFLFSCSEAQENNTNQTLSETNSAQKVVIAKNVTVDEFKELIEQTKGTIVDVRTPGEFNSGNIEGAKNINIAGNFSKEIQELDKNAPIFVYCAVGGRSSRAMQMMTQMGFKEVYNLSGGYTAWSRN